jgi:DNA processing protein
MTYYVLLYRYSIGMPAYRETSIKSIKVPDLLGRPLNDIEQKYAPDVIYFKGIMNIPLQSPRVSIVGSRKASSIGIANAKRIARVLAKENVVIVSGLAEGIDTAAHESTMESNGKTIAVIGTPLDKTYPAKNFHLQQKMMHNYLVISQFPVGYPVQPKNFVIRNRTMALISDATIIVEAGKDSGSIHQGWEALRLGRSLFILESNTKDTSLLWPKQLIEYGAIVLSDPNDVLESLPSSLEMPNIY